MSFLKIISLIVLLSTQYFSQQLYLCKGYTTDGEPIDIITNKKIETKQTVCILFSFKKDQLDENIIFLYVDKINSDKRENNFSKLIRPHKEKKWLVTNYKFDDEGLYEIYITDFNRHKITSERLNVFLPQQKSTIKKIDVDAYPEIRVFFCERILNEKPYGVHTAFSINKTNGDTYIYLLNNRPFNSAKLLVNIWRKKQLNSDFDEFIDTKKFEIKSNWQDTYFKYRFRKSGDYKINFFNENELLIKTAYITVRD